MPVLVIIVVVVIAFSFVVSLVLVVIVAEVADAGEIHAGKAEGLKGWMADRV